MDQQVRTSADYFGELKVVKVLQVYVLHYTPLSSSAVCFNGGIKTEVIPKQNV